MYPCRHDNPLWHISGRTEQPLLTLSLLKLLHVTWIDMIPLSKYLSGVNSCTHLFLMYCCQVQFHHTRLTHITGYLQGYSPSQYSSLCHVIMEHISQVFSLSRKTMQLVIPRHLSFVNKQQCTAVDQWEYQYIMNSWHVHEGGRKEETKEETKEIQQVWLA